MLAIGNAQRPHRAKLDRLPERHSMGELEVCRCTPIFLALLAVVHARVGELVQQRQHLRFRLREARKARVRMAGGCVAETVSS